MAKSHSLLELSQSIERVISRTFNSSYWVTAEISRLNYYPKSGHCYPELVEKQHGKIVAEIRSTIWSRTYQNLATRFQKETGEELKQGMKILFAVQVKYSPTHGISLNITDIDPSFTLGEIAKEKKMAIATLKKEGVFNQNHQLAFPYFPQRIAIISVITSKGYQDFLETIESKGERFNLKMHLFPAILQGDVAVGSIMEQLDIIQHRSADFDLVMIIRGGGGDVGLHCYNNVNLARMVATFPLPLISGIGHATNQTVVEMVANTNKITPTAVADTIIERLRELEQGLVNAHDLTKNIIADKVAPQWQRLLNVIRFLKSTSAEPLTLEKLKLQQQISKLAQASQSMMETEHSNLTLKLGAKLKYLSEGKIKGASKELDFISDKIKILDPKSVLKRGFSMSLINNKTIHSTQDLQEGDVLKTVLYNGEVESTVTKISNHE